MSRKGFYLGGIGTFWHVMVWALAMIADLLMMNMIHRTLQDFAWLYWRFGFGTLVFGFVMFVGTSVWHIVSDEVRVQPCLRPPLLATDPRMRAQANKFMDGDAPPWMMSLMIGSIQISVMFTGLQAMHMDDGHTGHWNGLIPGNTRPDYPEAALRGQYNIWVLLVLFSLSMKVLAHKFLRNNQEWSGPKKALKTEGPFARPAVSAILIVLVLGIGAAIAVLYLVYGDTMMREMVVLGVVAGVTLITVCCLGDNRILAFGRYYDRQPPKEQQNTVLMYFFVSLGVAFGAAAMVVAITTRAEYLGVIVFLLAACGVTLAIVLCLGPRPLLGLAFGRLDSRNSRTDVANYLYFAAGVGFLTTSAVIFAIYGDSEFTASLIFAILGVVTVLVVCFAGQNPLLRFKRAEPAITPSASKETEIFGPTNGTYVVLMLLLAVPVTLAFVFLVIEWRADWWGIAVVIAAVLFFFACCVCGQNLLPWLVWRDRKGMVEERAFGTENLTYIFFTLGFLFAAAAIVAFLLTGDVPATVILGVFAFLVFVFACFSGPGIELLGVVQKTVEQKPKVSVFSYGLTMLAIALITAALVLSTVSSGEYLILQIVMVAVAGVILVVTFFCGPRPLMGLACGRRARKRCFTTDTLQVWVMKR